MPIVKPTCLRDLKFRVNIVDVVGRVATLKRAGSRFKGLCPFHNEKTPSFTVDPDKGFYKCFGCDKAGDIIQFVRETEGLDFTEAIETLGRRYNVAIEYEEGSGPTREERSLRQELFAIHEIAADHFHQVFKIADTKNTTGEWMREYWKNKRRFTPDLAEEFKIGAVAPDGSALFSRLHKERFSEEAFRRCGLFFINENAPVNLHSVKSRFRGRLMIPIRDHQGRVVAFTARQTDLTPQDDPAREAKYVNSPETPIFTKGHLLFNLDRARTAVGPDAPFVLVEGQLDALRCWSVGLKTAIAPQGTAITESQLTLLRRYHPQVECLFDGDSAGQNAALRYLPLALKAGLETRFLALAGDEKIDPDDLFRERGIAAYAELKRHAQSAMTFACRSHLPDPAAASAEQKHATARALFDIILATDSEITRAEYLNEIASRLRIPINALSRDFEAYRAQAQTRASYTTQPETPAVAQTLPAQNTTPEYHLLLLCLNHESLGVPIAHLLTDERIGWIDQTHPVGQLLNTALSHFEQNDWPGRDHLDEIAENDEQRALAAAILAETCEHDDPRRIANQALTAIRNRALEPQLRQIELALSTLQANSEVDAISLIKQRTDIQRQLRQPFGLPAVD
ncbi:DNA primase [Ereboglobus sp. PH5-5]|uniref:DNA primase n=1 Tax=unclassified Ereboglobus TaxID=2626932 RepID=UPI002406DFD4|nr:MULTISPECIES: DNA primase [unclassified Ereboglobus]MDF9827995.1 DNA primase [Ereboglobus sp. PH5-10]MDF9832310.1 DNA primase [Ereboglobus sp. PH5-5]